MTNRAPSLLRILSILVLTCIWLGLAVGISFVATPVKFLAPSLALSVALDVGRHTFMVFSRIEWCLSVLLLLLVLPVQNVITTLSALAVVAIVAIEAIWLLPILDARVGLILAGEHLEPTFHHGFYIGMEVAKIAALVSLLTAGWVAARRWAGFVES